MCGVGGQTEEDDTPSDGRVGSPGTDEPATVVTLVPIAAPPMPYVLLRSKSCESRYKVWHLVIENGYGCPLVYKTHRKVCLSSYSRDLRSHF